MYRYKYNKNYHHKSQRAHRTTVLATLMSLAVLVAVGYVAQDVFRQQQNKQSPVSRTTYSSVKGATVNAFRSKYFVFEAGETWKEEPNEERDGHYVYRNFKGSLVIGDLIIDVNNSAPAVVPLVQTSRIIPVKVQDDGRLTAVEGAGAHCADLMPKNAPRVPTKITARGVTFTCTPDSALYQVMVGQVGGTTNILLPRPDGSKATYSIQYRDLTVSPSDLILRTLLSTFQTQ